MMHRINCCDDKMKVIYFDTETTGLDCRDCQIIELAMITVIEGKIVDEYDRFIKVDGKLPPRITEITGITD
jgi:DNA polymerase III alpha subunit (gram-positive type)